MYKLAGFNHLFITYKYYSAIEHPHKSISFNAVGEILSLQNDSNLS